MYYIQTADRLTRTVGLAGEDGGRHRLPARRHRPRQARHLRRAGAADAAPRRHLPVRMDGGRRRPREAAALPAVRQHRRDRAEHRVRHASAASSGPPTGRATSSRSTELGDARRRAASGAARAGGRWVPVGKVWRLPRRRRRDRSSTARRRSRSSTSPAAASGTPRQNMCPHKHEFVLSRGILGDQTGHAQGRLPAAQEDVLAGVGRVPERRGLTGSRSSRSRSRATTCTSSSRRRPTWTGSWRRTRRVTRRTRVPSCSRCDCRPGQPWATVWNPPARITSCTRAKQLPPRPAGSSAGMQTTITGSV